MLYAFYYHSWDWSDNMPGCGIGLMVCVSLSHLTNRFKKKKLLLFFFPALLVSVLFQSNILHYYCSVLDERFLFSPFDLFVSMVIFFVVLFWTLASTLPDAHFQCWNVARISREALQAKVSQFCQFLCIWYFFSVHYTIGRLVWRLVLIRGVWPGESCWRPKKLCPLCLCLSVYRPSIVLLHASAWQGSRSWPLYLITGRWPPHRLLSLCPRFPWVLSLGECAFCGFVLSDNGCESL